MALVGSRVVVERNYAVLPPEGIPESVLPDWSGTSARILTAPAMGARFAQYKLDVAPDGGTRSVLPESVEGFLFVLEGRVQLDLNSLGHTLDAGGYAYMTPGSRFALRGGSPGASLLWLKKRFEPWGPSPPEDQIGSEKTMAGESYMGTAGLILKTLLPADPAFDMAMNIFTFPPGDSLPVTETHVMEHGLYFLQGQGVYYLGDRWMEVQAGDFIWMGPYCPQSFYATGHEPARYIYYKDVNRDVTL